MEEKELYPYGLKKSVLKELVSEQEIPKRLSEISFGLFSPSEMQRLSEIQVVSHLLFQLPKREPMPYGPLDPRMGVCNTKGICSTCGQKVQECAGHFGYIKLALPDPHAAADDLQFLGEFDEAVKLDESLAPHLNKAQDDLNPIRIMNIFSRIPPEDLELMDMNGKIANPTHLVLQHLLVPPITIRPSVAMDASQGSNEDDLTMGLGKILNINNALEAELEKGNNMPQIMEKWDALHINVALYINSETPGIPPTIVPAKPTRGLCQRLKGKKGRFRGNLSGKRVDFSGRTVISPDPNLRIDEVALPELLAKVMTYPERVNAKNIDKMRKLVLNGTDKWPGANGIIPRDGGKLSLKFGDRSRAANNLRIGDIVERHLLHGDVVLFNRQPSLHRISIMCHRVRVMPWRTFRFNECVCGPYNADFDGDEMNVHVPQTEEARAEAMTLMAVNQNLITPRNGEPLVAATQDFLTASYLVTRKDAFFDRAEFCRLCSFFVDADAKIDIPPPAIVKPMELWTGKQLFYILLRPNKNVDVCLSMEVKGREYTGKGSYEPLYMCRKDGYVVFHQSELLCGIMDKKTLGGGSKENIFHVLMRDYSTIVAADRMSRLAKFCARWLADWGFSIGISDVMPSDKLKREKDELIQTAYAECRTLISEYKSGKLQPQPGCNVEQTLEAQLNKILSDVREACGTACINELHPLNAPLIMALCGSKGSNINISQMIACVGQQTVSGSRVPEGFIHRTLPHFGVNARDPEAKGFVKNSFFTGLTGTEFFFHTMGGREGLVDTAVKTAETGYMQRRLMKALEDLAVQYDDTVRNCSGGIVQFVYGDDGLDPTGMEGRDKPVDFSRVAMHIKAMLPANGERGLTPWEMTQRVDKALNSPMFRGGITQGVRDKACSALFIDDIRRYLLGGLLPQRDADPPKYFKGCLDALVATRKRFGLDACEKTQEPNPEREEENCARVWYESMNCVERAPADEKEKDRAARERALADRQREKATLLAERGIDFTLAFPEFFAALPADVRAQRRIAHTKAVDGAVINKKGSGADARYNLLVEGYNLLSVMATPGVVGSRTTSNHIIEVMTTLGIEAARVTIMNEIQYTMKEHGMNIDTRHVMLLADLMCFRGEILGITRHGIDKMNDSVMMLASFEKTTDHLFNASFHARQDTITGVSESIIMGIPIAVGTGLFKLLRKTPSLDKEPKRGLLLDSLTDSSASPSFTLDIASALAATSSPIS
ncbi:DNAdirected RNA polymerase subunit A [Acanthamoeba castellanii str. Neff]|uniref:DNA-directed RNA polymerase subunit n=1 Tax=Acanthamoeba castellanii (strain ATCC 30010 / Neff) TaxID=1257118 RepID=L8GXY2_ACACF|nr:DNAdirected RNA polymerase subunit A [Acanthamoeba castellanii str. Neff]ELR16951.1 DNAdirected RNA polymerase subunit A [Acanthamoeba castellanii str. Neff]